MRFEDFESAWVDLPMHDIDTDQIIPARFLKAVDRSTLRDGLFHALRFPDGVTLDAACPLHAPGAREAAILLAGRNFGCGSSREHAAWALRDWGFRVVVAPSFGDIFQSNALKNGLLPVTLPAEAMARLREYAGTSIRVSLREQRIGPVEGPEFAFTTDPFAQRCLLEGVDELGYLLARRPQIEAFAQTRPVD